MVDSNNKRLAKNTIYLYIRTVIVMIISLYTSREVLKALGENDLGIYNVVGGIVTLMAFLQSAQVTATSRFITFEIGQGREDKRMSGIFSVCMTIHILIALAIVFIAETVGLWIINKYTTIPPDRLFTANIVYQFSILTFVIHFIRCPYDSVIIANENMSVYAYMSIIEVVLKLGIVIALLSYAGDRLLLYGGLTCGVAFVLFQCYFWYTRRRYPVYKFRWTWDRKESKAVLTFSGWTLLGSSANTFTQQGVSLLFNNFVGLVANTALGFANQVNAAVNQFVGSFSKAFNPQIIKYYAQNDRASLYTLMIRSSKFSFFLCYIFALPLIINMDFVLKLWLDDVPQYTTVFCQLILVCTVIDATTSVLNTAITASGKIKGYQICISISFMTDLICAFFLFKMHCNPALVFGSRIITRGIINMFIGLYFANINIHFSIMRFMKSVIAPILLTIAVTLPVSLIHSDSQWGRLLITTSLSVCIITACLFGFIMNKGERTKSAEMIKSKLYGRAR